MLVSESDPDCSLIQLKNFLNRVFDIVQLSRAKKASAIIKSKGNGVEVILQALRKGSMVLIALISHLKPEKQSQSILGTYCGHM